MAWIIEFVSKMGLLHHYLFTIDKVNTLQIFGIEDTATLQVVDFG